ncbi:hypothetical protein GOP47_0026995 [Adiantum capillus-veneris]|nr:hypothetical protein GOP47_0026995 [Adiantum capillus-veneris]
MSACRKIDCSSQNCILFVILSLSLDITLLSFFSGWLATTHGRARKVHLAGVIITSCLVSFLLFCLGKAYRRKVKEDVKVAIDSSKDSEVDAEFLASLSGLPTRFSFKDLESATSGFSRKLGRGGFGSVYFGSLADGSEIAVKRLEKGGHGQKEFCAEVDIISRVRHANLVCMKGFCVEGAERLLVYEYMPRGSLERWIFHEEMQVSSLSHDLASPSGFLVLNWDIRYRIAVETARGLAYLHEECEEAILHLDVKPQNILLDERFHAKVSDFGLSRSMDRAQSRLVTTVRGTPGYLAPEWFSEGGIGVKTDVYGYGMLVLELVSGRRSVDQMQDDIEDWFLPAMAFRKLKENRAVDVIDPLLQGKVDALTFLTEALTTIRVALWCIQEDASKRPSMSSVVQMLEGKMKVTEPPLSRNFLAGRRLRNDPHTSITIIDDESLTLPR